jgi:WD domain, G-beta repeat
MSSISRTTSIISLSRSMQTMYAESRGCLDRTILVWDFKTREIVAGLFTEHTNAIRAVTFPPDRQHIVSGSADHTIRVWDAIIVDVIAGSFVRHCTQRMSFLWRSRRAGSASPRHREIARYSCGMSQQERLKCSRLRDKLNQSAPLYPRWMGIILLQPRKIVQFMWRTSTLKILRRSTKCLINCDGHNPFDNINSNTSCFHCIDSFLGPTESNVRYLRCKLYSFVVGLKGSRRGISFNNLVVWIRHC